MDIFYDFELDEALPPPKDPDSPVLRVIREFVQSRFRPLEEEIDRSRIGDNIPFIVIILNERGLGIRKFNIPSILAVKIDESFTQEDFEYLQDYLDRVRSQE